MPDKSGEGEEPIVFEKRTDVLRGKNNGVGGEICRVRVLQSLMPLGGIELFYGKGLSRMSPPAFLKGGRKLRLIDDN